MDASGDSKASTEEALHQPITRTRRTYGRRKEVEGTSALEEQKSASSSRVEPLAVESKGARDNRSSSRRSVEEFEDVSELSFGWKKKMADIDRMFDEKETLPSAARLQNKSSEGALRKSSSTPSVSTDDSLGRLDDSIFSGSLPPLTSSQTEPSSPSAVLHNSQKNVIFDSDESDAEKIPNNKESSPTSPLHPHPINTPGTKSSPTPPSSDLENEALPSGRSAPSRQTAIKYGSSGQSGPKTRKNNGSGKRQDSIKKLKKLNKKEERESKKAHARIMNEQHVSVAKRSGQLTINDLLGKIQQTNKGQPHSSAQVPNVTSSDPIQDFTSSPLLRPANAPSVESDRNLGPSDMNDESDDELPDLQGILQQHEEKRHKREAEAQRKKDLALAKQRILAANFKTASKPDDSEDDELEVVDEKPRPKRSARKFDYEKTLAGVVGFRMKGGRHSLPENLEGSQGERALKAAAKPAFIDHNSRRASAVVDHRALQAAMFNKASKQSIQLTKEKEEDWQRRGGKLPGKQRASRATETFSLEMLAERLSHKKAEDDHGTTQGNDDQEIRGNESDGDWKPGVPDRGSATPPEGGSDEEELSGDDTQEEDENRPLQPLFQSIEDSDDENVEKPGNAPRRTSHKTKRLVVSDSENELDRRVAPPRILVPETSMIIDVNDPAIDEYIHEQATIHRGSISSVSESTPDEDNKENDTRLMFDHGEDKENASVPRHIPVAGNSRGLSTRQSSGIFDLEEQTSRLSMSPGNEGSVGDSRRPRKPLQTRKFGVLDDPFALRSPVTTSNCNTPKASPKASRASSKSFSPKALAPPFGGTTGGFSQLFNDGDGVLACTQDTSQKAFLQPAFQIQSKLGEPSFQSTPEPKPLELGGFSQMFSPEPERGDSDNFRRPGNADELSLTLDTRLQPAVDVSTQVRRKAEAIFEKEQVFVLEEAAQANPQQQQAELYVTENGMLTQTKPDVSTPVIYRSWSPSQDPANLASQATGPPPTTQRMPLRTLSLTSDSLSPSQPHRLSRLIKGKGRAHPPVEPTDGRSSVIPSSRPKDAFSVLLKGAQKQNAKKLLQKSEFIEGEAQESDEDENFGFGGPKKTDDDESDSDDLDANVEGLLDDAVIDAEQLAEDKVLEKVQEQLEQDDAALQKYHEDAIEGKFRSKRRGRGIAMDDSDSDPDEDEDARQLRKRLHKKRKIDGDTLDSLKKDPASVSFYEAYQKDVQEDDNDDFAHLAEDEMAKDEDDDEENQQTEVVSTSDIHAQLREVARQKVERPSRPFNPEDVRWAIPMDISDDEDLEVNEMDMRPRKTGRRRNNAGELIDFDMLPKESGNWNSEQLAAWKREQSGRHLGTGGMRGAVTVTGHGTKGERSISSLSSKSRFTSGEKPEKRKVSRGGSMLMKVSDKQSRFG